MTRGAKLQVMQGNVDKLFFHEPIESLCLLKINLLVIILHT